MSIALQQLEGRAHFVVPCVMMVVGVLQGSAGKVYYPKDEIAKSVPHWNGRPVVVYHPDMYGSGTASSPDVFNRQKVGVIFNTRLEGLKLKADAWIDRDRVTEVDDRVLNAIVSGTTMELSTGLYMDTLGASGTSRGGTYDLVGQNYKPDHLALLPDQKGACSIADGAGFIRNLSSTHEEDLYIPAIL